MKTQLSIRGQELASILTNIESIHRRGRCGGIYLALYTRDSDVWYLSLKSFSGINLTKIKSVEIILNKKYLDIFIEARI